MKLPEYVLQCLTRLETAGFTCFAVGGCVRDHLLGLQPHDFDLCTAATPTEIKTIFFDFPQILAGEKHGTVGIITEGGVVEITTFRTESAYLDNRHPDEVKFVSSIREDLARRDFTVNAMAWNPRQGLVDPFGGAGDLQNKILRAVGDPFSRFREDSLRILRGVRFAVRFGLQPEENTLHAMIELAPLMENLARERVFDELCKLLPQVTASDLLLYVPILTQVIPELASTVGFNQKNSHHVYDVFTHTAHVVENTPPTVALRWAALLHDVGKPTSFTLDAEGQGHFLGHAGIGAEMADTILRRLKSPTQLRQRVVFLIEKHMTPLEPDRKLLRRRLSQYSQEPLEQLLSLQEADFCAKGVAGNPPAFDQIKTILADILAEDSCLKVTDLAVNGHDLQALGIYGKSIGQTLAHLLQFVLDDQIPNDKDALLGAAKNIQLEGSL